VLVEQHQEVVTLPGSAASLARSAQDGQQWLSLAEQLHSSTLHPAILVVDWMVVAAVVAASGGSRAVSAAAAAAFLIGGWLSHLYRSRSTIEAQGLQWYVRLLPLPLLAVAGALSLAGHGRPRDLVVPLVASAAALTALRTLSWLVVAQARRRGLGLRLALAVGSPDRIRALGRRAAAYPEAGVIVVDTYSPALLGGSGGMAEELRIRSLLERDDVTQILFAAETAHEAIVDQCLRWCDTREITCSMVLPVGAASSGLARIGDLGVVPLGRLLPAAPRMWSKRVFDVAASALLLVLLMPVLAITSLAVWLYDRGPVFYRQRRVGRDDQVFRIWKFRSMVPGADELNQHYADANISNGLLFKLPQDPRVTPVGNLIRRFSIDELPQLLNVLVGDMSLVGPRPLPVEPSDFDSVARRRHQVRPGITGPWQVAGGHVLGYDDMIKLDLAYVDSWSLRRDLWYLAMTMPTVMVRRSAY
jgi:lipopolysaccharide/colanic/teichoic acid biosynthesis glycosyltransferase